MAAGELNLSIEQGATLRLPVILQNADGTPVILSNKTGKSQIREESSGRLLGEIEIRITGENTGAITIYMGATKTKKLDFGSDDKAKWDAYLIDDNNPDEVDKILEGEVDLDTGITKIVS